MMHTFGEFYKLRHKNRKVATFLECNGGLPNLYGNVHLLRSNNLKNTFDMFLHVQSDMIFPLRPWKIQTTGQLIVLFCYFQQIEVFFALALYKTLSSFDL